jgi:3-phosphoshikimate 1-carboxyvinyltransferase
VLILAALADGVSVLRNVLLADDTWLMIEALRKLGIPVTVDEAECVAELTGRGGHFPVDGADLFCGNSGTTIRFCTALAALSRGGKYRLDGIARMRRRPIGMLTDALQSLGVGIEYEDEVGFPPLTVHACGLRGGHVTFPAPSSSQFVSGLLLAAPYASSDVFIDVGKDAPSVPFLSMTVRMMEQFGVPILADGIDGEKNNARSASWWRRRNDIAVRHSLSNLTRPTPCISSPRLLWSAGG